MSLVLFLVAVINPPRFCMSSSGFIDESTLSSMLASRLPPSLIDTHSLSTAFLGFNPLCMVIIFLVLWSICLSSSLVRFNNGPEYLTRETAQILIPLTSFLLLSFVSSNFLALLRYSFFNSVFHLHLLDGVSICRFPFLRAW